MVCRIYLTELQLNKANSLNIDASFLELDFSITNVIVSSKIYVEQDGFNFDKKLYNFYFVDRDVPRSPSGSYGLYICIWRMSPNVSGFNNRKQFLTAKLLKQGY